MYAEINVLQGGLLPLLLKTGNMGQRGTKIALACVDLITSLTWPIDAQAEIRNAFERGNESLDLGILRYLEQVMVLYKSAIIHCRSQESNGTDRDVLSTIMLHVLLPSLSKPRHLRSERDTGTISMCLHLFRNLLAVRDPASTSLSSAQAIADSRLQSELIVAMDKAHILETLLTIASSADSRDMEPWNAIVAESVYHIFIGSSPRDLITGTYRQARPVNPGQREQVQQSKSCDDLALALTKEARQRTARILESGTSRHSRFGTSLSFVDQKGERKFARNQASLRKTAAELAEGVKERQKRKFRRRRLVQEQGAPRAKIGWTREAQTILQTWAERFVKLGFESLTRTLLMDIRSERAKLGDIDTARIRFMQLAGFFLDYFLIRREAAPGRKKASCEDATKEVMTDVTEAGDGAEEKHGEEDEDEWPFALVAGWLDDWALKMAWLRSMGAYENKDWLEFVAAIQLWTVLFRLVDGLSRSDLESDRDLAELLQTNHYYDAASLDSAKTIFQSYRSQSFSFLDAVIDFANVMPKMLERFTSNKEHIYVKAKRNARKSKAKAIEDGDAYDMGDVEEQAKKAAEASFKERRFEFEKFQSQQFCSNSLANACILYLGYWEDFARPAEQLASVVNIMHRMTVKASELRLFFPYERRNALTKLVKGSLVPSLQTVAPAAVHDLCKLVDYIKRKFAKLSPDEQQRWAEGQKAPRPTKPFKMPAEIKVDPSRGHLDDIGIAVALLIEKQRLRCVMWVKEGLENAARERQSIVDEVREEDGLDGEDDGDEIPTRAREKFSDYVLPYNDDEQMREDASHLPQLKLLCRLVGMKSNEGDDHDWTWVLPSSTDPDELAREARYVEDFIRTPFETGGQPLESFVKRARQEVRRTMVIYNEDGEEEEIVEKSSRKRNKGGGGAGRKNVAPRSTWVEDDFIEDSDEEMEQVARLIEQQQKGREQDLDGDSNDEEGEEMAAKSSSQPRPRPRPRPQKRVRRDSHSASSSSSSASRSESPPAHRSRRRTDSVTPVSSPPPARPVSHLARYKAMRRQREALKPQANATETQKDPSAQPRKDGLFLGDADDEADSGSEKEIEQEPRDAQVKRSKRLFMDDNSEEEGEEGAGDAETTLLAMVHGSSQGSV